MEEKIDMWVVIPTYFGIFSSYHYKYGQFPRFCESFSFEVII